MEETLEKSMSGKEQYFSFWDTNSYESGTILFYLSLNKDNYFIAWVIRWKKQFEILSKWWTQLKKVKKSLQENELLNLSVLW